MAVMIKVKNARNGSASAQQKRSMVRFQTGSEDVAGFMAGLGRWADSRGFGGSNSVILQSGISRPNQSRRCFLFLPRAFVQLTMNAPARYGLLFGIFSFFCPLIFRAGRSNSDCGLP
jgi:hypothetical protein